MFPQRTGENETQSGCPFHKSACGRATPTPARGRSIERLPREQDRVPWLSKTVQGMEPAAFQALPDNVDRISL